MLQLLILKRYRCLERKRIFRAYPQEIKPGHAPGLEGSKEGEQGGYLFLALFTIL